MPGFSKAMCIKCKHCYSSSRKHPECCSTCQPLIFLPSSMTTLLTPHWYLCIPEEITNRGVSRWSWKLYPHNVRILYRQNYSHHYFIREHKYNSPTHLCKKENRRGQYAVGSHDDRAGSPWVLLVDNPDRKVVVSYTTRAIYIPAKSLRQF